MFSLKRFSGPGPANIEPNNSLPNSYGKIRTLKEDLENFQSGKREPVEEIAPFTSAMPSTPSAVQNQTTQTVEKTRPFSSPAQAPIPAPGTTRLAPSTKPDFQASSTNSSEPKKDIPNPFGSDTYFSTKSPFDETGEIAQAKTTVSSAKKSSSGLIITLSVLLALAALGGGFYYYWFFLKKPATTPASQPTSAPPSKTQGETSAAPQQETPANKKVRALIVDSGAGSTEFQAAFQRMATDLSATTPEGELFELRLVGKNSQPLSSADFVSVSSLTLPSSVVQKFSANDYSLFFRKESGKVQTGMVMKLADQTGVSEELLVNEKQVVPAIGFLYLGQTLPAADFAFNSSKYKSADIRYFNFPSPSGLSLDYSVIKSQTGGYLIFATSKDVMRSILDYMSEK